MNNIKLTYLILIVFLAGCQVEILKMISNLNEINNLSPTERCEQIRVDLREDCRKRVKKEVDELSEAMKKNKE